MYLFVWNNRLHSSSNVEYAIVSAACKDAQSLVCIDYQNEFVHKLILLFHTLALSVQYRVAFGHCVGMVDVGYQPEIIERSVFV